MDRLGPCFSKEVFSQLDYVLTDSWTVRDASGKRIKAFGGDYDPGNDAEAFMKWYVDWIVEILETTPLDIWSHPMWVTRKFTAQLEQMWTEERMRRVIATLKNTNTAVEIDSSVKLPTMPFLKMAKAEGIKFCFGASSQGARINPIRLVDRHRQGTRPHAEGHVPAGTQGPEADPDQEAPGQKQVGLPPERGGDGARCDVPGAAAQAAPARGNVARGPLTLQRGRRLLLEPEHDPRLWVCRPGHEPHVIDPRVPP